MFDDYLDSIGRHWKGNVPLTDRNGYVEWWFRVWHKNKGYEKYLSKWVVWC